MIVYRYCIATLYTHIQIHIITYDQMEDWENETNSRPSDRLPTFGSTSNGLTLSRNLSAYLGLRSWAIDSTQFLTQAQPTSITFQYQGRRQNLLNGETSSLLCHRFDYMRMIRVCAALCAHTWISMRPIPICCPCTIGAVTLLVQLTVVIFGRDVLENIEPAHFFCPLFPAAKRHKKKQCQMALLLSPSLKSLDSWHGSMTEACIKIESKVKACAQACGHRPAWLYHLGPAIGLECIPCWIMFNTTQWLNIAGSFCTSDQPTSAACGDSVF